MNMTRKLFRVLAAGGALAAAAPAFADPPHYRGYERDSRYGDVHRIGWREDYFRHDHRHYEPHRTVIVQRVVERPYVVERVVERPVYYEQHSSGPGVGAIIGAAVGTIYDATR